MWLNFFQFFTLIFGSGKPSSQNNISSVFEFCVKSLLGETKVTFFLFFNNEIVTAVELIPDPITKFSNRFFSYQNFNLLNIFSGIKLIIFMIILQKKFI